MDRKDLEQAIEIRAKIKAAEEELAAQPPPPNQKSSNAELAAVESALNGTTWSWGNEFVQLRDDGLVGNKPWTDRGLVTRWKVIDRRTVLIYIEKGRDSDHYAIWTLSLNLTDSTGFGFEGRPLQPGRRKS